MFEKETQIEIFIDKLNSPIKFLQIAYKKGNKIYTSTVPNDSTKKFYPFMSGDNFVLDKPICPFFGLNESSQQRIEKLDLAQKI